MFDAHLHLQDHRLAGSRERLLAQAREAGVSDLCTCATAPDDWETTEALAGTASPMRIHVAFGVHPWHAADLPDGWPDRLRSVLLRHPQAAVGEAGLDGLGKGPPLPVQRPVLEAQIGLAIELGRPLVLHGARAWAPLYDCCKAYGRKLPPFLLHGFSGSPDQLRDWSRLGAFFSFSGSICNPASTRLRALPPLVPDDRLLVETDSPDMLPFDGVPLRPGTRLNGPANLPRVIREVAALRETDAGATAELSEKNALRFFGIG